MLSGKLVRLLFKVNPVKLLKFPILSGRLVYGLLHICNCSKLTKFVYTRDLVVVIASILSGKKVIYEIHKKLSIMVVAHIPVLYVL